MAGYFEALLTRRIELLYRSLKQPFQGTLYDSPSQCTVLTRSIDPWGAGWIWRTTTIEVLPEDVLIRIFDFYRLDAMEQSQGRPWKWHRLAHVCRKWRYVISISPRRLGLRILCEYGEHVGIILDTWPTLPLVAKFYATQKSKHIPGNVMVALRHPDRLCEIDLHVTGSMLPSIVEVTQKPCRALESIRITVEAHSGPSTLIPSGFLCGSAPHLRIINLDGIAFPFPKIGQVILSTKNLVELHLSNIPDDAYFSPNDLVTGLSSLVQLERLTVGFHSPASSPPPSMTRTPQRTTLPSLMSLDFHGANEYLEEFVAGIDSPALCKFVIRFFNDVFFEIPKFCQFILRLNALRSPARAILKHSVDFVGIFFEEGNLLTENCFLGASCRQLDYQLSFVTQILNQLSSILSSVHSLDIQSDNELPTGEEDMDSAQWVELFQLFTHTREVCVWEKLVPSIVQALVAEDMTAEVLPELTELHLSGNRSSRSVAKVAGQFVAARKISGCTVFLTFGDVVCQSSSYHNIMLSSSDSTTTTTVAAAATEATAAVGAAAATAAAGATARAAARAIAEAAGAGATGAAGAAGAEATGEAGAGTTGAVGVGATGAVGAGATGATGAGAAGATGNGATAVGETKVIETGARAMGGGTAGPGVA